MSGEHETTDQEFLSYCLTHSTTPAHLFAGADCRRLFRLAKTHFPDCRLPDSAFRGMDRWLVSPLVEKARKYLSEASDRLPREPVSDSRSQEQGQI